MTVQTVSDITSFKWATVTGVSPLAIRLDGDTSPLALIPDSLIDPASLWVGARVRVELSLRKVVVHGTVNGGDGFASGDVITTARGTARAGWLLCRGQSLIRVDYPSLFDAIGTTYGAADSTHFSIPNISGRALVGMDTGQTEFDTLGEVGGAKTHTLTAGELPNYVAPASVSGFTSSSVADGSTYGFFFKTSGSTPHNNLQPYIVLNYMIKV